MLLLQANYESQMAYSVVIRYVLFFAVLSAVIFLGDNFGFINAIGLVVLVFGAGLFNYSKYQKLVEREKLASEFPGTEGDNHNVLSVSWC